MRLARLDLLRYGRFTDASFELPQAERDIHIVFGPNEAGKTTSLTAIEDMLFGIPERSPYNFLHSYDAMRVGAVLENGGDCFEFQRLEARTPFLDRDLIDFAQSIPASLKMKITDEETQETTEKWILRKACEDLLPAELVWRKKAQFDEGSGTVDALNRALSRLAGVSPPVDRETEGRLYERLLREQYEDPGLILENAGMWTAERVAV